ncbi:HEAT repeat domain-containing protein [Haladaptatus sp. NG-SE-30]
MTNDYSNRSARARSPADDEAELRSLLESPFAGERRDAALALVDRAEDGLDDGTVAALTDHVQDEDVDVRQFSIEALGVVREGKNMIRTALSGDDDEWVRAEAVVALSRIDPDDDTLSEALSDESGWVRRNAIIALGKTARVDQETLADRIKDDPHPAVREYAALYLGDLADDVPEAVRLLAAVLARDPEAFVRAKAAESLGELATDRAEQALEIHGITDRSDDVKRTAKRALASARGVDPDQLDVEIDDGPPGGGPQSWDELPDGPVPESSPESNSALDGTSTYNPRNPPER